MTLGLYMLCRPHFTKPLSKARSNQPISYYLFQGPVGRSTRGSRPQSSTNTKRIHLRTVLTFKCQSLFEKEFSLRVTTRISNTTKLFSLMKLMLFSLPHSMLIFTLVKLWRRKKRVSCPPRFCLWSPEIKLTKGRLMEKRHTHFI